MGSYKTGIKYIKNSVKKPFNTVNVKFVIENVK